MRAQEIELDITAVTPFDTPQQVSATLFVPDAAGVGESLELIVGLPGGGYTRSYYHPAFEAPSGYSFAEDFTGRGYAVLALDHYGTGASSQPVDEAKLSRAMIAEASHRLTLHVVEGLEDGRWFDDLAGRAIRVTGVGHSMGGMMAITQQGLFASFDRLVVAGWTNYDLRIPGIPLDLLRSHVQPTGYQPAPRALMRHFFYSSDVPADLVAADEAHATVSNATMANDAGKAGVTRAEADRITCPIFLFYSDNEVTDEPAREVGFYRAARDITLFRLDGMAHIHNFEPKRFLWWDRLDRWIASTAVSARA